MKGIYQSSAGALKVIADRNTVVPGRAFNFVDFSEVIINHGDVAFIGEYPGGKGIYCTFEGNLTKVVDLQDTLEPLHSLNNLTIHRQSLDGTLAFTAIFNDGYRAMYVAQIPEPTILTTAFTLIMGFHRRRPRVHML